MRRATWLAMSLSGLLSGISPAQEPSNYPPPSNSIQPGTSSYGSGPTTTNFPFGVIAVQGQAFQTEPEGSPSPESGVPAESRPGQQAEESGQPVNKMGPTPVQDVKLLQDFLRQLCHASEEFDPNTGKVKDPPVRIYGWLDMGYTASTSGKGPLSVEPRPNHFGDEFTLNQLALTIERPLDPKELSWGFVIRPYGGSDATLYNPIRGAVLPSPRSAFRLRHP